MLQGGIGGAIGLSALFILFFTLFSANASENLFQLNFFSLQTSITIILASMVIGCLGCYISLRQFLKI
jgi:cell division transport system permease protein